ncbi:RNA polymerase sigma factor [Mangrovibacterium lignilyticum]|uniref:RNA polymerase sigma factor n=1 Tax=Mangrovibacterium lignilyticum TaxID=2668052 RepID=UPI0013CFB8CA|nr:sigma-70 family RNA polymerase sigma factor [Mangrovibacterium lignilyticum]
MTQEEFTKLFDLYFADVRKYIFYRSGDEDIATDIAQDAFMRIWEKQMTIDGKTAKSLLIKIARDLYINRYHKEKKAFNFFESYQINEEGLTPEDQLNFDDLKMAYEKALKTMPEKQREVFLMSRIDELKYKEIADQLGLSVKAIEKRMSLALDHLKTHLKDKVTHIVLWFSKLFFCMIITRKSELR